jgi:hypothetical protein
LQEIEIRADNIDGAAEKIISFLERTRHDDVIYLDGWYGLGASALLKAVVERCRSSSSGDAARKAVGLDKIIHIDCSLWQSKRSLQKVIAEELKLPREVMVFFDQCDEEDDFDGVHLAARGVIPQVKGAILDELSTCKFLVVFHNGSGSYVDLWECGVPVMGVRNKRVLWTSRGRFLFHGVKGEGVKKLAGLSDVVISIIPRNRDSVKDMLRCFLHAEAKEVARNSGVPLLDTKIVLECILYNMALIHKGKDINWAAHVANYWVCDGIIQDTNGCGRSPWEIGDALHRNMNLDWHKHVVEIMLDLLLSDEHRGRWASVSSEHAVEVRGPTSIFWTEVIIEVGMFKHLDRSRLRVLHLSRCSFSFSAPPFLSCSNIRFLLLDQCKDTNGAPGHGGEQCYNQSSDGAFFLKLWVLELSYTDWYWLLSKKMLDMMVELRELNVIGPSNWSMSHLHSCSGVGSNSRKLLKLRVVEGPKDKESNIGNTGGHYRHRQASSFPELSSWEILKTVILDGCCELEEIGYNTLPPSLESFSFTSNVATKIKSISFRGCAMLKSLLLKGLFDTLEELDMSGTLVKTLDLSEVQTLNLRRLFLLGCEKLRAILWPKERSKVGSLKVLRIDTTHGTWAKEDKSNKQVATSDSTHAESSSAAVLNTLTNFDSYISLRDPRVSRSLMSTRFIYYSHIEILSTGGCHHRGIGQNVQDRKFQSAVGNLYTDEVIFAFNDNSQTAGANGNVVDTLAIRSMWTCPVIPVYSGWAKCYISIHDEKPTKFTQDNTTDTRQQTSITLPSSLKRNAESLHLHDLSITCIPGPNAPDDLDWNNLKWCQLERCPNLQGSVFSVPSVRHLRSTFSWLETFWASQLLKARYIWDLSTTFFAHSSFWSLTFLHIDYCPRLVHVLPLYRSNSGGCHRLETLEIICCGELREVFPCEPESQQQEPRVFPRLKRIHLHELPALQQIYGGRMLAPRLETVKIRGCWSLKRVPAVRHTPWSRRARLELINPTESDEEDAQMPPTMDCEKDWWDGLEWDGEEAGHHPSYYKTTHSAFYKKTLLRATVLR